MSVPQPIDRFAEKLAACLKDGTFVRLKLSQPITTDGQPREVLGRCVELKTGVNLSLTLRYATRDVTKNLPIPETPGWVQEQLRENFRSALLGTTKRDWQFVRNKSGKARIVGHKPSSTDAPSHAHDQKRRTMLDDSARDWLEGLDVIDASGQVRASMADKHSQINRYLEIFSHLAKECGWVGQDKQDACPTLADMGCGKGYLTFGVWHLFHRVWQQPARIIGVEVREDLVRTTTELARKIGASELGFQQGTIESAAVESANALIALHACNTATDDAILRGIELGATLILVAPCCHKELRPQLGRPEPFAPVLEHGIMAERMAEWATDGLRALFLEWAGYRTKILEFVSSEHTPKNLMISAIRRGEPFVSTQARQRIEQLKEFFSIKRHALDALLQREIRSTKYEI